MKKITHCSTLIIILGALASLFRGTLDAKCYQERCFTHNQAPVTVHDYTEQFNEKKYWLEIDEDTGKAFICYQRLFLYPEFFQSPEMRCFPAQELKQLNTIANGKKCWYAEGIVLCDAGAKSYTVYPKTRKICGEPLPADSTVLGQVKNTGRTRKAGDPATCTIVKIDDK